MPSMATLEGNHNVASMEQFSPVMQVEVAARETLLTWPSNNHMGYNQYPLDDIFELSRLFAYTLSSSGQQKGSQGVLNQSTTPKPPPPSAAQAHASDSAIFQAPSWLRVDELTNWIGDEPTGIECNSALQGLGGHMDLQGAMAFPSPDLPEFVETTSPLLCMQPYTEPTFAKENASLVQAATSCSSLPKDESALLMDVSFPPELAKAPLNGTGDASNSTGVSFLPKTSVGPTAGDEKNLSNIKVVKEIQLSQRVDEECFHLSIEDTKRITLKVSKVSNSNHQDEAIGICDRMKGESMHAHEKPINRFAKQGVNNALHVSHTVQKVINHSIEEHAEKVDETFEDCLSLDLQDIAPLDSLVNTQFGAPKIGYTPQASGLQDVAELSFNNESSLAASLSALSTNDQHSPSFACSENTQIRDYPSNYQINPLNYQHAQPLEILPLTNVPYPYMCAQDPIANNCWDLSCIYPNTHMMSFSPSSFPTDTTSRVFNPDINQSEASQMHAHYTSHKGACYFPNKINGQERIELSTLNQGLLPLTRASFSKNKFTNLHWSSPAAKTRAARKRRMARKLFHVVPYQARPSSSSLTLAKAPMPKNTKERASDSAPETSLVLEKKSEGQISCVDETKLRFLLQKRLKPSDVGNLGRIILPKRDAEAYLPRLNEREGIWLDMEDINGSHIWSLKFRYWPNNKSRMYLLEQTRGFVNYYKLREGDYFILYRDDFAGKYVIRTKRCAK